MDAVLKQIAKWRGLVELVLIVGTCIAAWTQFASRVAAHDLQVKRLEADHAQYVTKELESAHFQELQRQYADIIRRLERLDSHH